MPSATLVISIARIINKLHFSTVAGDLHERFHAEMITTKCVWKRLMDTKTVLQHAQSTALVVSTPPRSNQYAFT